MVLCSVHGVRLMSMVRKVRVFRLDSGLLVPLSRFMIVLFNNNILRVNILVVLSHCVFMSQTTQPFGFGVRVIFNLLIVRVIREFVIVILSKVNFLLLVMLGHVGQYFLNALFTGLCPQNEQIEFVSLQFYNDLSDSPFEVQASQESSVVFLCELFFT